MPPIRANKPESQLLRPFLVGNERKKISGCCRNRLPARRHPSGGSFRAGTLRDTTGFRKSKPPKIKKEAFHAIHSDAPRGRVWLGAADRGSAARGNGGISGVYRSTEEGR